MWQDCFSKTSQLKRVSKQSTSLFHSFLTILLSSENRMYSYLLKKRPENEQLKAHSCQQTPSTSSLIFGTHPKLHKLQFAYLHSLILLRLLTMHIPTYTSTFAGLGSCYLNLWCCRFVFPRTVTENVLIVTYQCQKVGNYEVLSLKNIFLNLDLMCINFNSEKYIISPKDNISYLQEQIFS